MNPSTELYCITYPFKLYFHRAGSGLHLFHLFEYFVVPGIFLTFSVGRYQQNDLNHIYKNVANRRPPRFNSVADLRHPGIIRLGSGIRHFTKITVFYATTRFLI